MTSSPLPKDRTTDLSYLPDNIPECHRLINDLCDYVRSLEERIAELEKKLERRNRRLFDRQSANVSAESLSDEARKEYEGSARELAAETAKLRADSQDQKEAGEKRPGGGRKAPQLVKRQRTEEHRIDDPKILACPCCGTKREVIGFDVDFQLDVIRAVFETVKHIVMKYACPECRGEVITADRPDKPIEKGYPTPGLITYVGVSKFDWHLPLYRQEKIYRSQSIPIDRSSMSRWLKEGADIAKILVDRMKELILNSRVIQADETNMPLIKKGLGKTHKGHIWQIQGEDSYPYNIYDFTETGEGKHPERLLKGFTGILQTDGAPVFNGVIENGATQANCVAHAYRKFEDARKTDQERADFAIAIFKSLYDIERVIVDLSEEQRKDTRQRLAKPKLEKLKKWLDEQAPLALPKSPIGEAIAYCLNRWEALCLYTEHGFMRIDNNTVEAGMRPVALGRGNWLFVGSAEGGETAAIWMTLIQTCHRLDIDPFDYLRDLFTRLPSTPISQIDEFLPDRWKAQHMTD